MLVSSGGVDCFTPRGRQRERVCVRERVRERERETHTHTDTQTHRHTRAMRVSAAARAVAALGLAVLLGGALAQEGNGAGGSPACNNAGFSPHHHPFPSLSPSLTPPPLSAVQAPHPPHPPSPTPAAMRNGSPANWR
jgi:hypothetical protein